MVKVGMVKAGMLGMGAGDAARGPGLSPGLGTRICAIHVWCSQRMSPIGLPKVNRKKSRVSLFLMHEKLE